MKTLLILGTVFAMQVLEYGKPQPYKAGETLKFAHLSLTYDGFKDYDAAPATVHVREDLFTVKAKGEPDQKVVVSSGQNAPEPVSFVIGKTKYTLYTFRGPKDEDLHPGKLIVSR